MIQTKDILKTYFETGDFPTEAQFTELIDSFRHIQDGATITSVNIVGEGGAIFNFSTGESVTIDLNNIKSKLIQDFIIEDGFAKLKNSAGEVITEAPVDDFVKKSDSNEVTNDVGGENVVLNLPANGSNFISLTNDELISISEFNANNAIELYPSKEFFIKNQTSNYVTVKNDALSAPDVGNIPAFLKNGEDIVIPPKETLQVIYSLTSVEDRFRSWSSEGVSEEDLALGVEFDFKGSWWIRSNN